MIRRMFKWIGYVFAFLILAIALFGTAFAISGWNALGKSAQGDRLARMESSTHYKDGTFQNIRDQWLDYGTVYSNLLFGETPDEQNPSRPVPTATVTAASYTALPESGLRVTWFGHSSSLIEIDGVRVLTDPIWSKRASPVQWTGPARWFGPLIAIKDLPPLDAVVVSHDHYDHLDMDTI